MQSSHGRTWTLARIAAQLEVERHRVQYVVRTRGIEADDRVGVTRTFGPAAVERIRSELNRIAQLRAGGEA